MCIHMFEGLSDEGVSHISSLNSCGLHTLMVFIDTWIHVLGIKVSCHDLDLDSLTLMS